MTIGRPLSGGFLGFPDHTVTVHPWNEPDPAFLDGVPGSAEFLARVDWYHSPFSSLMLELYLSVDSAGQRWLLWHRSYDDNKESWGDGEVAASVPCGGLDAQSASLLLLEAAWRSPSRRPSSEPFHCVDRTGLLDEDELFALAEKVWPGQAADKHSGDEEDDDDNA